MPPHTSTTTLLTPLLRTFRTLNLSSTILSQPKLTPSTSLRPFTSSTQLQKKQSRKPKKTINDQRVALIRYFLQHPLTPRPLRFGRLRALRHWTIHRAWQLFRRNESIAQSAELQRYVPYFYQERQQGSKSRKAKLIVDDK